MPAVAIDETPSPRLSTGVRLDRDARRIDARLLLGGQPGRLVRLSARGGAALDALLAGGDITSSEREIPGAARLAARLIRAGMLHPEPAPDPGAGRAVTVVVPVRDRAELLPGLLGAMGPVAEVLVVDDGSTDDSAEVAERAGARVLRRATAGGPAAARNLGLSEARTPLVAFLDSDCVPRPGWLERLAGHLADPAVVAAAPRIVPVRDVRSRRPGAVALYESVRSALDMGSRAAEVRPGSRVPYVPAAALLVRREQLIAVGGLDEGMRFGEDVDLVWRLTAAGHAVRYEPSVQVAHHHPVALLELLARRHGYGRAAGPLAVRHPEALVAADLTPWTVALLAGAAAGSPALAAGALAGSMGTAAWRLGCAASHDGEARPRAAARLLPTAARLTGAGQLAAARHLAEAATRTWLPLTALALAATSRGPRVRVGALLLTATLVDHRRLDSPLDPVRFVALRLAEDAAYCSGVWRGCVSECTMAPLRLRVRRRPAAARPVMA